MHQILLEHQGFGGAGYDFQGPKISSLSGLNSLNARAMCINILVRPATELTRTLEMNLGHSLESAWKRICAPSEMEFITFTTASQWATPFPI